MDHKAESDSRLALFRDVADERYAVRYSGTDVIIESIGDYGCHYMTGGKVITLHITEPNFAPAMSGGLGQSSHFISMTTLDLEEPNSEDLEQMKQMIDMFVREIRPEIGSVILND
ncbi:unnamed protein product [Onchocerca flexuosa]|uniref:GXGXG domain-containing protein n=1 Tax=Onchocerca flexuosa TaxID=387005 RepID=A0A183H5I8_9BILA|nr:unnamed protein product [Onchocerca flexuosa]